tara:strand:+ start:2107 stop:2289 length:183 start_codon:yes stop_codon:yes gene_type:complete
MWYMCIDDESPVKISDNEARKLLRGGTIEVKRCLESFHVEMMDRFKNQIQVTNITKLAFS